MANVYPAQHKYLILPANTGNIAVYESTSDENPSGAWSFLFIPSLDFDGSFQVMARTPRISSANTEVPFIPAPYRRVTLNNVASDYAIVTDTLTPSGPSLILVPAAGLSIGILLACNAGSCLIYAQKMTGSTTP